MGPCNACISQAVKDVRANQDTLVDIFERVEMVFRRLEMYMEAQPTEEMITIFTQMMVEVFLFLEIATKELKRDKLSE